MKLQNVNESKGKATRRPEGHFMILYSAINPRVVSLAKKHDAP